MAKSHGKFGKFYSDALNNNVYGEAAITEWAFNYEVDQEETTDSKSDGHKQWTAGCDGGDFTAKAFWDPNEKPTTNPPNLSPGKDIKVRLGITSSSYFQFPAQIGSMQVTMNTKNVINWSVSGKTNGEVTMPT